MPNWKKVIVSGSNAVLNNITASGHLTALGGGFTVNTAATTELEVQGNISASGKLFASMSNANGSYNNTVMYDTSTGQFYYTGSYGGGSTDGGTSVTANTGDDSDTPLTSITIDGSDFSIAGQDDDWDLIDGQGTIGQYVKSDRNVIISGSTSDVNPQSTLTVQHRTDGVGASVFKVTNLENQNLLEVLNNTLGSRFSVNSLSGVPIFSVEDNGEVIIDNRIKFTGGNGSHLLIDGNEDLGTLSFNGACRGDIVKLGATSGLTTGYLYYWNGSTWVASGLTDESSRGGLLGIALGDNSGDAGMLLRGIIHIPNTVASGQQVYMGNSGTITTTAPSSNGQTIRSIGHSIQSDVIYFNPSPDYIIIGT